MYWEIPKLWKNRDVVILGGGVSLPGLLKGRAFYKTKVIGVNSAFLFGDWVNICYFGDARFWFWNKEELEKYRGLLVSANRAPYILGSVKGILKIKVVKMKTRLGICPDPGMIYFNRNSGAGAINLAYHLGCRRVYLVGFDMRCIEGKKNWRKHPGTKHGGSSNKMTDFFSFKEAFRVVAKDAKRLGLEVFNATPGSALEAFPIIDFEELYASIE